LGTLHYRRRRLDHVSVELYPGTRGLAHMFLTRSDSVPASSIAGMERAKSPRIPDSVPADLNGSPKARLYPMSPPARF